MDILNFDSWIEGGKYSLTMPTGAVTVVGVPNTNSGNSFLPVTVPVTAFAESSIGKQLGGGIVVAEWDENGVKKALVASLTDLGPAVQWTEGTYWGTAVPGGAMSPLNGFTNTNNIIAQTLVAATALYAAGAARLHTGGSFTDWYLPATWELNMCYNAATVVNRVLGATGFATNTYWSSTEPNGSNAWLQNFANGAQTSAAKSATSLVRAVRIHNL